MHRIVEYLLVVMLAVGAGLAAAALTSCASAPRAGRIVECLTDPERDVLWCDGVELPWKSAADLVCHKLDDHEAYREGVAR